MTRVPKKIRLAAEEILKRRKAKVPLEQVSEGDIIQFDDLLHGNRYGRIVHIHPRARRLVVGALLSSDLPRGYKSLARYTNGWRLTIAEAQVQAIHRKAQPDGGSA